MLRLYEEVIRKDEYRRIASIESFEQDIRPALSEINARLDVERRRRGMLARMAHFVTRRDLTWREKLAHRRRIAELRRMDRETKGLDEPCIIGWHSMLIRVSGIVAPCCILQGAPLGNVYKQSIRDVWYGEEFARFRGELSRIINAGDDWQPDAGADRTVVAMCGGKGAEVCPIKSFYYKPDVPFRRQLTSPAR